MRQVRPACSPLHSPAALPACLLCSTCLRYCVLLCSLGYYSVCWPTPTSVLPPALPAAAVLPGAGAFEVAAAHHLRTKTIKSVEGRAKLGVEAFAEVRRLAVLPACLPACSLLSYYAIWLDYCILIPSSRLSPPCLSRPCHPPPPASPSLPLPPSHPHVQFPRPSAPHPSLQAVARVAAADHAGPSGCSRGRRHRWRRGHTACRVCSGSQDHRSVSQLACADACRPASLLPPRCCHLRYRHRCCCCCRCCCRRQH